MPSHRILREIYLNLDCESLNLLDTLPYSPDATHRSNSHVEACRG